MQDQELNADDLIEMVISCEENSDKYDFESDIENNNRNVFTAKFCHEGLVLGRKLGNHSQGGDRGLQFQRGVNDMLKQYEGATKAYFRIFSKTNSQQTLTRTNSVNAEEKFNEIILSSDESEIIQLRKRKLMVESDSD